MKKLIPIFLCILLLAGCSETYDGPTETREVLTEYEVNRMPRNGFDGTVSRSVYAYDVYGNRVRELGYRNGELEEETRNTYDDRGNLIKEVVWDHSGWIAYPESRRETTYDDQDRVLKTTSYNFWGAEQGWSSYAYDDDAHTTTWSNSTGDQVIYYYDENGLLLYDTSTGVGGNYETVFEYDDHGNRIGWTSTQDGRPWGSSRAGFDDQNRLIWVESYDENGTLTSRTTYTYDDEAHSMTIGKDDGGIRIEYYCEDGRMSLIEDYDETGELIMTQIYGYTEVRVPADGTERSETPCWN